MPVVGASLALYPWPGAMISVAFCFVNYEREFYALRIILTAPRQEERNENSNRNDARALRRSRETAASLSTAFLSSCTTTSSSSSSSSYFCQFDDTPDRAE